MGVGKRRGRWSGKGRECDLGKAQELGEGVEEGRGLGVGGGGRSWGGGGRGWGEGGRARGRTCGWAWSGEAGRTVGVDGRAVVAVDHPEDLLVVMDQEQGP